MQTLDSTLEPVVGGYGRGPEGVGKTVARGKHLAECIRLGRKFASGERDARSAPAEPDVGGPAEGRRPPALPGEYVNLLLCFGEGHVIVRSEAAHKVFTGPGDTPCLSMPYSQT